VVGLLGEPALGAAAEDFGEAHGHFGGNATLTFTSFRESCVGYTSRGCGVGDRQTERFDALPQNKAAWMRRILHRHSSNLGHAETTDRAPWDLREGRTVISTSWRRPVRNSIRRPMEKLPARLRISRETCGWRTPRILAISTWVLPLALRRLWICR